MSQKTRHTQERMNDAKVRAYFEVLGLDIHDATWLLPKHPPKLSKTTLPETNIAPENDPLEKEIPIGNHPF